jgi:hypothetical protein
VNITHGQFAIDRQVTMNTDKAKQDKKAVKDGEKTKTRT